MAKKVKVVNLSTGDKYIFIGELSPVQAVNACFEQQTNGNYNTWEYDKTLHLVEITQSGLHCFRGDFSARMAVDTVNNNYDGNFKN